MRAGEPVAALSGLAERSGAGGLQAFKDVPFEIAVLGGTPDGCMPVVRGVFGYRSKGALGLGGMAFHNLLAQMPEAWLQIRER